MGVENGIMVRTWLNVICFSFIVSGALYVDVTVLMEEVYMVAVN